MTRPPLRPWAVWWVNLSPQVGHEQAGRRPAVVVGSQLACGLPNGLAIIAPVTSTDRGLPFHPAVTLGNRRSFVMTDQVKSISTDRLLSPHRAQLTVEEIESVQFALRQMIDV